MSLNQLDLILQRECQLDTEQSVLVGVSGGPDSLCLFDALHQRGYPLVGACLDHGVRPEAEGEVRLVRRFVEARGCPFVTDRVDTMSFARSHTLSLEEAGRILRYRFLFQQAERYQAQAVAVGHNADDQVETVWMHLLQGAGLDGLTGMAYRALPNPWSEAIPLVRPLLGVWREDIEQYCRQHDLNPAFDRTNLDTAFFRNWLRQTLIPAMEARSPQFRRRLWQTAWLLRAERDVLEERAEELWAQVLLEEGQGFLVLHRRAFLDLKVAYQRRLVRMALSRLLPDMRDVDFAMVQQVVDFCRCPTASSAMNLGLGLRAVMEEDRFYLAAKEADLPTWMWPQIPAEESELVLPIPGVLELEAGWVLRADFAASQGEGVQNRDPFRAWLDLGGRKPQLVIRPRRAGERFKPLGMGGKSLKVSDLMINEKIPRRARDRWPLVCTGRDIAWVPGCRLSEDFRLTESSQQVVCLQVERKQQARMGERAR